MADLENGELMLMDQLPAGPADSIIVPSSPSSVDADEDGDGPLLPRAHGFLRHFLEHQIYPPFFLTDGGDTPQKPSNIDELRVAASQDRPDLLPPSAADQAYRRFVHLEPQAKTSSQLLHFVHSILQPEHLQPSALRPEHLQQVTRQETEMHLLEQPFTNLSPLTNHRLITPIPHIYHGTPSDKIPEEIIRQLGPLIKPSVDDCCPMVPNFFLTVSDPEDVQFIVEREAMWYGALGARAMHSVQCYLEAQPIYDTNAYSIASTFAAGQLKIYATHYSPPTVEGGRPYTIMTQLGAWAMSGDVETFRKGVVAYINLQYWAKAKREEFIRRGNARYAVHLLTAQPGKRSSPSS